MRFTYPILLTRDEIDGGFVVTSRDLPEVITQGNSLEECLAEAADALDEAIHSRIKQGLNIPQPSKAERGEHLVPMPVTTAMKAAVYLATQGQKKVDLAAKLGVDEKEVRRMLDPKHPTKASTLEHVLGRLGKRVEVLVH
jgi:antitoxin HicB